MPLHADLKERHMIIEDSEGHPCCQFVGGVGNNHLHHIFFGHGHQSRKVLFAQAMLEDPLWFGFLEVLRLSQAHSLEMSGPRSLSSSPKCLIRLLLDHSSPHTHMAQP